jgi:integrase
MVVEVLAAFSRHAAQHYRTPDGKPTNEVKNFTKSVKPLRELFDRLPAAEFGPLALKAVRQRMIDAGICRTQINKAVIRIRHVFKWAASEQLAPASVFNGLQTVAGLQAGRTNAVESAPVEPVEDAAVDATLPFLNRHVRGLVQFQRFTGCRPGEACALRRCDLDTSGPVWLYKPPHHKTAHRGKRRTIAVGPQAQAVVAGFFTDDAGAYLFSPRLAVAEMRAELNANRKTKLYPSQVARDARNRKADPKRKPADRYSVGGYGFSVRKAVERANARGCRNPTFGPALPHVPAWAPNQIRHSHATRVRKEFSIEHAGAALGHSKMSCTEVYALRDESLAVAVAGKIG